MPALQRPRTAKSCRQTSELLTGTLPVLCQANGPTGARFGHTAPVHPGACVNQRLSEYAQVNDVFSKTPTINDFQPGFGRAFFDWSGGRPQAACTVPRAIV
jgi:hypothetical protein